MPNGHEESPHRRRLPRSARAHPAPRPAVQRQEDEQEEEEEPPTAQGTFVQREEGEEETEE